MLALEWIGGQGDAVARVGRVEFLPIHFSAALPVLAQRVQSLLPVGFLAAQRGEPGGAFLGDSLATQAAERGARAHFEKSVVMELV